MFGCVCVYMCQKFWLSEIRAQQHWIWNKLISWWADILADVDLCIVRFKSCAIMCNPPCSAGIDLTHPLARWPWQCDEKVCSVRRCGSYPEETIPSISSKTQIPHHTPVKLSSISRGFLSDNVILWGQTPVSEKTWKASGPCRQGQQRMTLSDIFRSFLSRSLSFRS